MTPNQTGALFMMAAMGAYTLNDALVKLSGADLPLSQILVLRGAMATGLLILLARFRGEAVVPRSGRDWGFVSLRAVFEVAATYFFLNGLLVMPIANANAIMQMLPLTVTLFAALFLPERVGWRRLSAIGVGFLGMVLIVRPGVDGFAEGTGYVMIAVLLITARDILTRYVPATVPAMTIAVSTAASVMIFGGLLSLGQEWVRPTASHVGLLAGASVMILCGYVFSILSMRQGDVSFTAPFRYFGLLVALFVGLFVFDQWPDAITLLGAAIVVGAGLFTLSRETQSRREKAQS